MQCVFSEQDHRQEEVSVDFFSVSNCCQLKKSEIFVFSIEVNKKSSQQSCLKWLNNFMDNQLPQVITLMINFRVMVGCSEADEKEAEASADNRHIPSSEHLPKVFSRDQPHQHWNCQA